MGCTPSKQKRPVSSRSWMAGEGWLVMDDTKRAASNPTRTASGKVMVTDYAKEDEKEIFPSNIIPAYSGIPPAVGLTDEHVIIDIIKHLRPGQCFEDPDFPPDDTSLFYTGKTDPAIVWMSPKDLVTEPKLFIDGTNRSDIMQGSLGDCWFLSSCAAVCQRKELMDKILPDQSPLSGPDYNGAIRVRFWRYGRWVDIYIDDRLPTKQGRLIYARNTDPNEFWVSLLEKAYAKLHGSYEALEGGQAMDALVDLTGGLAERYELVQHTQDLYLKIARAAVAGALITCSRKGNWRTHGREVDENGLVAGHAYTVSAVKRIKRVNGSECLLRIRNPWGHGEEWKGAWSDKDHRWQLVDDATKECLQFLQKDDGEFWMSYKDFCKHFQEVTICTLGPDFDGDGVADAAGQILILYGKWEEKHSAGGCRNDLQSFSTNPQYLLTVYEYDKHECLFANEQQKETCSVLIALMQEHKPTQGQSAVKIRQIGFIIYKTTDPEHRLNANYFMYNYEQARSGTYVNFREVCGRYELEPGNYVIIPSTYNKDDPDDFMIRVFSTKHIALRELPDIKSAYTFFDNENKMAKLDYEQHIVPPPVTETPTDFRLFDPHNGEDAWETAMAGGGISGTGYSRKTEKFPKS